MHPEDKDLTLDELQRIVALPEELAILMLEKYSDVIKCIYYAHYRHRQSSPKKRIEQYALLRYPTTITPGGLLHQFPEYSHLYKDLLC